MKLVVSDDREGLRSSIARYFQGANWQRCQFHFLHNVLDLIFKKDKEKVAEEIKSIFQSPDIYFALSRVKELVERYKDTYPRFTEKLEEEIEGTLSCYQFPALHRRRIRTTNCLERFNEEIRRRTRVIRIFPNETACLRLIRASAIEQNEEHLTRKRYLKMDELYEGENQILKAPPQESVAATA